MSVRAYRYLEKNLDKNKKRDIIFLLTFVISKVVSPLPYKREVGESLFASRSFIAFV